MTERVKQFRQVDFLADPSTAFGAVRQSPLRMTEFGGVRTSNGKAVRGSLHCTMRRDRMASLEMMAVGMARR
jgi:hypothetical protein